MLSQSENETCCPFDITWILDSSVILKSCGWQYHDSETVISVTNTHMYIGWKPQCTHLALHLSTRYSLCCCQISTMRNMFGCVGTRLYLTTSAGSLGRLLSSLWKDWQSLVLGDNNVCGWNMVEILETKTDFFLVAEKLGNDFVAI